MTTYAASINKSETQPRGNSFGGITGSGGVTAGYAVRYSTITPGSVVLSNSSPANISPCIGIALTTESSGSPVAIASNGCLVTTPFTLTQGGKVGITTGGALTNFTSGTCVGHVERAATLASVVRVLITQDVTV